MMPYSLPFQMRIRPEHNFGLHGQMARQHISWAMGQFIHFWELKWPPFSHFWSDLKKIATMLIPIDTCIIVRGNSKIYFWCVFWGIFFFGKISKSKILTQKIFFFGKSSETPKKIILSEIIFDPPHFGGQAALGSKCPRPLDSPWVVSYRCVIHYDAIFLTVSELDGLL